uniref:WAP four-disulfide core domain 2 n=1 Tax=Gasterosteus aculeatus aculeatus TaxID=481459 RepID=A0AAQ4RSQ4_GASAC
MEQLGPAVCVILALSAFVHHGIATAQKGGYVPGVCPLSHRLFGLCVELCSNDSVCPDDQKCCSNGCGHVCTAPYKVKPGLCPPPVGISLCAFLCQQDGQCPEEKKCCTTSCGLDCRDPLRKSPRD